MSRIKRGTACHGAARTHGIGRTKIYRPSKPKRGKVASAGALRGLGVSGKARHKGNSPPEERRRSATRTIVQDPEDADCGGGHIHDCGAGEREGVGQRCTRRSWTCGR